MNLQKSLQTKNGFTLIEIIISISLITTLLSFALFAYKEYIIEMQETSLKYEALLLLQEKTEELKTIPNSNLFGTITKNNTTLKWSIDKQPYDKENIKAVITIFYDFKNKENPKELTSFIILPA